jgi:energy-coupling factor transporter ATP-binding protein EcfA2
MELNAVGFPYGTYRAVMTLPSKVDRGNLWHWWNELGCGKSSLLDLVAGLLKNHKHQMAVGSKIQFIYLPLTPASGLGYFGDTGCFAQLVGKLTTKSTRTTKKAQRQL